MERGINETARRIVGQEVRYCASLLIGELLKRAYESGSLIDEEDAQALSQRAPGADEYEEAAQYSDNSAVRQLQIAFVEEDGVWNWGSYDEDGDPIEANEDFDSAVEAWRDAFDTLGEDHPEGVEVYEHWLVSDWLADKLEERGESVVRDLCGLTVWGRCTTGQAIYMDHVIQEIARTVAAPIAQVEG